MESEQDFLNGGRNSYDNSSNQENFSFPNAIESPVLSPHVANIDCEEELEMPQSIKYLHERYPLNEIFEAQQSDIERFMSNKHFHGIKYLFGLGDVSENKESGFLSDIDTGVFSSSFYDNPNFVDLNRLFEHENSTSQQSQHKALLESLTKKLSEVQSQAFTGISIHKTIGKAFYEHYENFVCLRNSSRFLENFQEAFEKLMVDSNHIKKCGPNLILMIYEFWMRMFREFVKEIWRHSEKYSLDMFKKHKGSDTLSEHQSNPSSTSSSQQGERVEREKRKQWAKHEIELLEKIIDSKAVFNAARLNDLAQQLGRSASSISSKIQKLNKLRKNFLEMGEEEDLSMNRKIEYVLKLHPNGLSKEEVIAKMGEMYEMGMQENWKKSASQILSSSRDIQKIKVSFRLSSPQLYFGERGNETVKDRLISCFLKCEDYRADVKSLSQIYAQLYEEKTELSQEFSCQKLKSIETTLCKALNRYDRIFQKEGQKIVYRLKGWNDSEKVEVQNKMEPEFYLS